MLEQYQKRLETLLGLFGYTSAVVQHSLFSLMAFSVMMSDIVDKIWSAVARRAPLTNPGVTSTFDDVNRFPDLAAISSASPIEQKEIRNKALSKYKYSKG